MAEEVTDVLKEIAVLLRRQIEQQDASARRNEEMRERFSQRQGGFSGMRDEMRHKREEFEKRREEFQSKMEKGRDQFAEQRQEDREFKQRLLAQLERQNQLLETLLERLGRK